MSKRLFTKKFDKEKFLSFFDKEGFYVVVFLCVAIIATTTVYVMRKNMDFFSEGEGDKITEHYEDHEYFQPEDIEHSIDDQGLALKDDKENEENDSDKDERGISEEKKGEENDSEKPKASEGTSPAKIVPENTEAAMASNSESSNNKSAESILNKLKNPVESTSITMDYSFQCAPVFSNTLNEYRSDHQGVDIKASKGSKVKASMAGKVVDIMNDPRLGVLVIIDHGNGVLTKYGNLDKNLEVTKNQQVKSGDLIGKVGDSAPFEVDDEPHVHFEIWNGDKPVDPKEYLKELK